MIRRIRAYRLDAQSALDLAHPDRFWDAIQAGELLATVDPALAPTLSLLPDYGSECGVPVPSAWMADADLPMSSPEGVNVVCYLKPYDLKVIWSRWAKRRPEIGDDELRRCFQFVVDLDQFAGTDADRIIVLIVNDRQTNWWMHERVFRRRRRAVRRRTRGGNDTQAAGP